MEVATTACFRLRVSDRITAIAVIRSGLEAVAELLGQAQLTGGERHGKGAYSWLFQPMSFLYQVKKQFHLSDELELAGKLNNFEHVSC